MYKSLFILKPIRDSRERGCRSSGRKTDERKTRDKGDTFFGGEKELYFEVSSLRSLSLWVGEE